MPPPSSRPCSLHQRQNASSLPVATSSAAASAFAADLLSAQGCVRPVYVLYMCLTIVCDCRAVVDPPELLTVTHARTHRAVLSRTPAKRFSNALASSPAKLVQPGPGAEHEGTVRGVPHRDQPPSRRMPGESERSAPSLARQQCLNQGFGECVGVHHPSRVIVQVCMPVIGVIRYCESDATTLRETHC